MTFKLDTNSAFMKNHTKNIMGKHDYIYLFISIDIKSMGGGIQVDHLHITLSRNIFRRLLFMQLLYKLLLWFYWSPTFPLWTCETLEAHQGLPLFTSRAPEWWRPLQLPGTVIELMDGNRRGHNWILDSMKLWTQSGVSEHQEDHIQHLPQSLCK